ncbi:hypothetical protein, partial [Citrobacter sp. RHBSTW-00325]|uniref:hypothetical protein n=1 Tax=Citrobacter sp. RHBSTW-00325 TaxID=2742644 RepID=UPI001C7176DE
VSIAICETNRKKSNTFNVISACVIDCVAGFCRENIFNTNPATQILNRHSNKLLVAYITGQSSNSAFLASLMMYVITPNIAGAEL